MTDPTLLRDALKNIIESDQLNDQELNDLQKLESSTAKSRRPLTRRRFLWATAAGVTGTTLGLSYISQIDSSNLIHQRIAHEVLTNHLKIQALDIETASTDELRQFFDRLDFTLFHSSLLDSTNYQLLGNK